MSKDYKNDIPKFLTEEKFKEWWKKGDSSYREILRTLNLLTHKEMSKIFEGDNHILKFFWFKLLTRRKMPAEGFDCDKAFFGSPSELVNDWQKNMTDLSPDTANSYTELFKLFLAFYLPDIFTSKEGGKGEISFNYKWTNMGIELEWIKNLLSEIRNSKGSYEIIYSKYKELKQCLNKIIYDNQLILFSNLILFQEELFRQLDNNCDKNILQSMKDFAKLTHTPGNFILVKDNIEKYKRYGDFIDLYIEQQEEEFIKEQHLSMYNEPLFSRKERKDFPNKQSFKKCVYNINKKIIQREEELKNKLSHVNM